jgi:restriction system protein
MGAIPRWVLEWRSAALGIAAYIALVVIAAVALSQGTAGSRVLTVAIVSMAAVSSWYIYTRRQAAREAQHEQAVREELESSLVDEMNWSEFEDHCQLVLEGLGYQDVQKTRDVSREKAVDITAIAPDGARVAVECKHWSSSVGVPVVRNLIAAVNTGLYKGRAGILMTSSEVTKEAWEIAEEADITVIDRSRLMMSAVEAKRRIDTRAQAGQVRSMTEAGRFTAGILCSGLVTVGVVAIALITSSGARPAATPTAAQQHTQGTAGNPDTAAAPGTVVRQFFAAIGRHDWAQVWLLGGVNLGRGPHRTYGGMVAGYLGTVRDVIVELKVTGDTAAGDFKAYDDNGRVMIYQFSYLVRDGTIASGNQVLVRTT